MLVNALMGSVGTPKVQPWFFLSSFLPVALLPEPTPSQGIRCPLGQYSPPYSNPSAEGYVPFSVSVLAQTSPPHTDLASPPKFPKSTSL